MDSAEREHETCIVRHLGLAPPAEGDRMREGKALRVVAYYFLVQGLAGLAWLIAVTCHLGVRDAFTPLGLPNEFLLYFWLPDSILFGGCSLATGVFLLRRSHRGFHLAVFTWGAAAYATLLTVAMSVGTASAYAAPMLMVPSLVGTSWAAIQSRGCTP